MLSTAFCVALLAATAVAFALTEGAKTELSPIFATRIAKVFSPVCKPALCHGDAANIDFRLRVRERLEVHYALSGPGHGVLLVNGRKAVLTRSGHAAKATIVVSHRKGMAG